MIDTILNTLGLASGGAGLIALGMIVLTFVGRVIPDNATGFAAIVRKLSKFLALQVKNRATPTDTM